MIVMLGVAGAGKSTQCSLLEATEKFNWLSVSRLIREKNNASLLSLVEAGQLIPSKVSNGLVGDYLMAHGDIPEIVIDGFPRDADQAKWLLTRFSKNDHKPKLRAMVHLVLDKQEALNRLLERSRDDDTPEAIKKRFDKYDEEITTILKLFIEQNIPIIEIQAYRPAEEVHKDILLQLRGGSL